MAKVRNHVIYPKNGKLLKALKEEYEWLGREVVISDDKLGKKLIILALPRKSARKAKAEAKLKARRNSYLED